MEKTFSPTEQLRLKFGDKAFTEQETRDEVLTLWLELDKLREVLTYLKLEIADPYRLLYDLTAIDERTRKPVNGYPSTAFTLVYHLYSFNRNAFLRLKCALKGDFPTAPTITGLWANAAWYEREVFDMFGIRFDGHKNLRRILMPLTWEGYPLRKEHPARATEMGPFRLYDEKVDREQAALQFKPEDWGMARQSEDADADGPCL
ncbi:MAG TPA: NADH-quinone oxidoreductase subunit C [Chryseosolibacter sp.]